MAQLWCYEMDFTIAANSFAPCANSSYLGGSEGAQVAGQGWRASERAFPPPVVSAQITRTLPGTSFISEVTLTVAGSAAGTTRYVAVRTGACDSTILQQQTMQAGTVDYTFTLNRSMGTFNFHIYSDANPSPSIYIRKVVVRGQGLNPFITSPQFALAGQTVYIYRAPITGNDSYTQITTNQVVINRYAVDPINNHLWLRTAEGWVKPRVSGGAIYVPDPQKKCSWIKVTSSTDPKRVIVPSSGTGLFNLSLAQIQTCLNNGVANATSDYPFTKLAWSANPGLLPQLFSRFPVSLQQLCSSNITDIKGLGDPDNPAFYGLPGEHNGVDVFAPVGSNVYSMANLPGLVVGIGVEGLNGRSAGNWGATGITEGSGFSVIIRHEHLYVLYGHLIEVDPSIYVGKGISFGTRLGKIGTANNADAVRHVHIEIRSFGNTIPSGTYLVKDLTGANNDYGVLINGGGQALNVYDVAQFFASTVNAVVDDSQSNTVTVTGLGKTIVNGGMVTFETTTPPSPCSQGTKPTRTYTTFVGSQANGYRGFVVGQASLINPFNPLTPTIAP